jgi:CDP-paratose 2-epimerase
MSGADAPVALITGGAGFIGTNLAHRLLADGRRVLILDNLSRAGVERNVRWLLERYPERAEVEVADILDARAVHEAVGRAAEIYHLAAQVAVTTSLENPLRDFDINARGTLNVLEAVRARPHPVPLIFTSTNKVYGALPDVALSPQGQRYVPLDPLIRASGIDESRGLDFHSPYGCSKGAADQYVLDYARCFGLPAVVFRMSCIYGTHQLGNEDQGWVAHFLIQARERRELKVFGDGRQVRDVLFVEDLVDAFVLAMRNMDRLTGEVFNIGGGPKNAVSLLELLAIMAEQLGLATPVQFAGWRNGDQRYFIANTAKFTNATGWRARISVEQGIGRLYEWVAAALPRARERGAPYRAVVQ